MLLVIIIITLLVVVSIGVKPKTKEAAGDFSFGSYILTQNALTDAPERYIHFINEFMVLVNEEKWPDYSSGSDCHDTTKVLGSQATKTIDLVNNSLNATIISNGIHVAAKFHVTATVPIYYKIAYKALGVCVFEDTLCNCNADVSFDVKVTSKIVIEWNQQTQNVSIVPVNPLAVVTS